MSDVVIQEKKLKSILLKVLVFVITSVIWLAWFGSSYHLWVENYNTFYIYKIVSSFITIAIGIMAASMAMAIGNKEREERLRVIMLVLVSMVALLVALMDLQTIVIILFQLK